jgi:TP901 family phage tail tape measure protein
MPSISYEFVASGHDAVRRAYLSIAEAEEKAAAVGARAARSSVAQPSRAKEQVDAWKRALDNGARRAAQNQVRDYERTEAAKLRVAERARQQEARAAEKARQQEIRAADKHAQAVERAKLQSGLRASREAARQQERLDREQARLARRHAQDNQGGSQGSGVLGLAGVTALAGGIATYGIRAVDKVWGIAKSAADESIRLQETASRISINARGAGEEFVDPKMLRKEFEDAAAATPGQKAQDIAEAVQEFVSLTGELGTARRSEKTFATVASATGATVGDVSQAAASIYNQFGIKGEREMQDVLASLSFQGKRGAFEMRDIASQFQRLAAAGASFGLSGTKGVKTIGGLAQIARTGTGSAEQTTTALENIFSNLIAKSAILKREGVNVYDKKGRTRDVAEVLIESIAKAGKNNFEKKGPVLQQVFGDQGIRGVRPLLAKYQTEYQKAQKNGATEAQAMAAGLAMLRRTIDDSINAPGAWAEVQKDAARAQQDSSAQLTAAWEKMKAAAGDSLAPALIDLAKVGADLAPEMVPAIKGIGKLATVAAEAAKGLEDMHKFLVSKGLLPKEEKPLAEQIEAARARADKAAEQFDQTHAGPLTQDQMAERDRIYADVDALREKLFPSAKSDPFGGDKDAKTMRDTFVAQYSKAMGIDPRGADMMAQQIVNKGGTAGNDWLMSFSEPQEATDLRHRYEAATRYQTTQNTEAGGPSQIDPATTQAALDSLAANVQRVNTALSNVQTPQASITGTTGPSVN